ncbi:hypothetical protein QWO81_24120, partial [Salmonella enterica subsp. enterica serovar Typhimurium]|nr:hypothetical protein [Salmonella enterica subsp. enterica serovar Typhimurium]
PVSVNKEALWEPLSRYSDHNRNGRGRTGTAAFCDGAGGKVKYCRYTDIYKVAVVGGDAGYLITGISK